MIDQGDAQAINRAQEVRSTIMVALNDRAENLRRTSRSRPLAGPQNIGRRANLREAAARMDDLARLARFDPAALVALILPPVDQTRAHIEMFENEPLGFLVTHLSDAHTSGPAHNLFAGTRDDLLNRHAGLHNVQR